MTFRSRLLAVCGALAGLLALLVIGILFSPDRVQARTSAQPLLPGVSAQKIDGIDIMEKGAPAVRLRRTIRGWETPQGSREYPASTDRVETFLRIVAGLRRTARVSSDPGHLSELGLSSDSARLLVLHQAGAPDVAVLVGKRGPGGDADYVQVQGQDSVYLARGSLSFFLSQARPSWYELHVLPDDVQGTTIAAITVSGAVEVDGPGSAVVRGGYTLKRPSVDKPDQWLLGSDARPADRVTAGAMASSLANLEGVDFAETSAENSGAGAGRLDIAVTTFGGKSYSLVVTRGPEQGKVRITTDWSPWTYVVNALPFQRAVLAESKLTAAR